MSYIKIQKIAKELVDTPEKNHIYFGYDSGGLWLKDDDGTDAYYILNGYASQPTILNFNPSTGSFNGDTLTINGSNFISFNTTVTFNGVLGTSVNVTSANSLTVVVPDTPGNVPVIVTTTYGGSSLPVTYLITHKDQIPGIVSITPSPQAIGSTVTINGYNFLQNDTIAYFGTTPGITNFVSPILLNAIIPNIPTGQTTVFLQASNGQSNTYNILVTPNLNPTFTNFYPNSGYIGDTISISGTNFALGQIQVRFGSESASGITVVSSTYLTAIIASNTPFGSTSIRVSNISLSGFTVIGSTLGLIPTISSILPLSQIPGSILNLNGSNLSGTLQVTFGGVAATVISGNSTSIYIILDSNTIPGINSVIVTNQYGPSLSFSYSVAGPINGPVINYFTPISGSIGSTVFIYGNYFAIGSGNAVYFDNVPALVSPGSTSQLITVKVPTLSPTGIVDIKVVNGTGTGSYIMSGYTVLTSGNAPIINNVIPVFAKSGDIIDVYGQYLTNCTIGFGYSYPPGTTTSTISIDDTHVRTTVPLGFATVGSSSIVNIYATTTGGTFTYSPFEIYSLPLSIPSISTFDPITGPINTFVSVYGNYFAKYWSDISVVIGGKYYLLTSQTFVSNTEINGYIPYTEGQLGSSLVSVITPAGSTQKSSFLITNYVPTTTTTTHIPTTTTTTFTEIPTTTTTTFTEIPTTTTTTFTEIPTTTTTTFTEIPTTTTTTTTTLGSPLILTFDNIYSDSLISGSSSVLLGWNTFFNLPASGVAFTSVYLYGNNIYLYGGSGITLIDSLFDDANGYGTHLTDIIDNANCIINIGYDVFGDAINSGCPNLVTVVLPAVVTSGLYSFYDCVSVTNFVLPSLVTDNGSFYNCTSVTSFSLPLLTTSVGSFFGCTSVTSFDLPSLITANASFEECSSVTSFNLPLLTTALDGTFANCTSITSFDLPSLITISAGTFTYCTSVTSFDFPLVTGDIGINTFENCTSATSFNLPLVTVIGDSCFNSCSSATYFYLPSVITAGAYCFANCWSITNIDLPSVTYIGDECFSNCALVTSFNLPNLSTAGAACFATCSGATSFNLPSLITIYGNSFFVGCSSASGFTLPLVTNITYNCFASCLSAKYFYLPSCLTLGPTVNNDDFVFLFITGNTITLTIPSALMTCNSGLPDEDIQILRANNTVTIITV